MNPRIHWPDETLPVQIYCAPGVLTSLEVIAADGLLAMPRTGLGVGGLLLGKRGSGRIEILSTVEISCSHALGPAFALTQEEIAASSGLVGDGSELVGWYCSKPAVSKAQSSMPLTAHDHDLFDALCPEPWQLILLIRPSSGKTTTAVFGLRAPGGPARTFLMGIPKELAWQELAAFQESEPEAAPVEAIEEPAEVKVVPIPIPMPQTGTLFGKPRKATKERKARRWQMRFLIVAMVLAFLSAVAFFVAGMGYSFHRFP